MELQGRNTDKTVQKIVPFFTITIYHSYAGFSWNFSFCLLELSCWSFRFWSLSTSQKHSVRRGSSTRIGKFIFLSLSNCVKNMEGTCIGTINLEISSYFNLLLVWQFSSKPLRFLGIHLFNSCLSATPAVSISYSLTGVGLFCIFYVWWLCCG